MDLELKESDISILEKFAQLEDVDDFCDLLEINNKTLIYLLYRRLRSVNYKSFNIKKKSGGTRTISAPISSLKIIQKKIVYILGLIYNPRPSVQGFCINKNIATNASVHCGKKVVLNFDLKDFFSSITFPRVRGLFISEPFNLSPKVATVLAQICTLNNELPQGAPTSPIISNLICSRLDGQLQAVAKKNNLLYTRYADDITFSSWKNNFPHGVAVKIGGSVDIGDDLRKVISSNWFSINEKKTRMSYSFERQEITGLIGNKFPNIKRNYIREVRVMLNNWDKYGIDRAESEYYSKRGLPDRSPYKSKCDFRQVILGKINFVKMVKGYRNCVYRRLINEYNFIAKNGFPPLEVEDNKLLEERIWIIEVNNKFEGTGFVLKGYGLVTCDHVIGLGGKIFAYRPRDNMRYEVEVSKRNSVPDLAVLNFKDNENTDSLPFFEKSPAQVGVRDRLLGIGFPLSYSSKELFFYEPKVVSSKEIFFVKRIILDKPFTVGMSGGPLLDKNNNVVGVIATGAENLRGSNDVIGYSAVPIENIDRI